MARNAMVSTVSPGPIPSMTPISFIISSRWRRSSSSTKMIDGPDMFPYSHSTRRLASSFRGSNPSAASTPSKIAGPPGCTAQKRSFQLPTVPSGASASATHHSMCSPTSCGISSEGLKKNPSAPSRPSAVPLLSGTVACEADTISNPGRSPETGSAPTTTAPAPSPHRPCMTSAPSCASSGAWNMTSVSSAQAIHEDARAAVVLGDVLGDAQRGGAAGAACHVHHGAAHGGAQAEQGRQVEVHAGHLGAGVAADDEVRDFRRRPAPLGDCLRRGRTGELGDGGGQDVLPRVQGQRRAVGELWVVGEQLFRVVEVALLDRRFVA
ncbi:unnamed protein product [Urochloa humidicola]